jgi:hypothetical protein
MNYTDIELKLIAHALDQGANREGEADNASRMFFKQLRKRGISTQDFTSASANGGMDYKSLYATERYNSTMYRMEAASAKAEVNDLKRKLDELTRNYSARPRRTKAHKGELLSEMEWEILQRIATYWGQTPVAGDSVGTQRVSHNNSERGTLSTIIRKGMIEKRCTGRVALTEAGLAYYNERKARV